MFNNCFIIITIIIVTIIYETLIHHKDSEDIMVLIMVPPILELLIEYCELMRL